MRTTIDADGRLVIPPEIRRQAHLEPGTEMNIRWNDGRIELEPAYTPVRLVREGHLLVAVPEVEVPVLTDEVVEETRQKLLDERAFGE